MYDRGRLDDVITDWKCLQESADDNLRRLARLPFKSIPAGVDAMSTNLACHWRNDTVDGGCCQCKRFFKIRRAVCRQRAGDGGQDCVWNFLQRLRCSNWISVVLVENLASVNELNQTLIDDGASLSPVYVDVINIISTACMSTARRDETSVPLTTLGGWVIQTTVIFKEHTWERIYNIWLLHSLFTRSVWASRLLF